MAEQEIEVGEVDHKQKLLDQAKKIEEGREEPEEQPEVAVDDEPSPEDDDTDPADPEPEEPRPSRAERRGNRFSEAKREAEENKRLYEQERARALALEAQIAAQRQPAQPQRSAEDERAEAVNAYERDIAAVQQARRDLQAIVQANADKFTPEFEQRIMQEDARLRLFEADAQRRYNARLDALERPAPPPPPDFVFESLRAKYPDVDQNLHARQVFVANVQRAHAQNPNRPRAELLEESFQQAQAWLRGETWSPATRQREKPTANSRAKFTGTGAGSASNGPPVSQRATITSEENRMAQKLYSHIQDPEERKRLYYKNVKMKQRA